jgi:hypothetical protein
MISFFQTKRPRPTFIESDQRNDILRKYYIYRKFKLSSGPEKLPCRHPQVRMNVLSVEPCMIEWNLTLSHLAHNLFRWITFLLSVLLSSACEQ